MSMEVPPNGQTSVYNEKGMTCIPKEVRDDVGIKEGDKLRAISEGDAVRFIKVEEDEGSS